MALFLVLAACSGGSSDQSTAPATAAPAPASTTTSDAPSDDPITASSQPTSTAPTTTASSTTTEQAPSSDEELLLAVRAFWDLYLELGGQSGTFDGEAVRARLAERATGAELNRLLAYFSSNAAAGYVVKGDFEPAPVVVANDGASAQVRDCYDDTTGLYRASDGVRLDTDTPERHQVLMSFVLEDGVWKVAGITDEGDGCVV